MIIFYRKVYFTYYWNHQKQYKKYKLHLKIKKFLQFQGIMLLFDKTFFLLNAIAFRYTTSHVVEQGPQVLY